MLLHQKNLIKSLFISKDKNEVPELIEFCESNSIQLIAHSLIKFKAIPFIIDKPFDVIFFGSIRAAEFFLKQEQISDHVQIACIGKTTAKKLEELGLKISFVGEKSGIPEDVAKEFKSWLGDRTVLIPLSFISNRSISSQINKENCTEIIVYDTFSECKSIDVCESYVFTSPSNFNSFLECNSIPKGNIIAWGETTRKAIEKANLSTKKTLEYSTIQELLNYLQ